MDSDVNVGMSNNKDANNINADTKNNSSTPQQVNCNNKQSENESTMKILPVAVNNSSQPDLCLAQIYTKGQQIKTKWSPQCWSAQFDSDFYYWKKKLLAFCFLRIYKRSRGHMFARKQFTV